MKKVTTAEKYRMRIKRKKKVVVPSEATLYILKAFARAYHTEKGVQEPFKGILLN